MRPNNGMHRLDGFTNVPVAILVDGSLREARMRGGLSVQKLAKTWRECIVGGNCGQVQSIAAGVWSVEWQEDRSAHAVSDTYVSAVTAPKKELSTHIS